MLALVIILAAFGLVPCVIGGIFLYVWWGNHMRAGLMQRTPTSPAASVARMRPGDLAEVKGTLRCEKPLTSELAKRPCASYVAWIERVYHEDEENSDGSTEIRERTETLARIARRVPFFVEDGSGRVRVRPDGAEVDGQSVFDSVEEHPARGQIRLGGRMVAANHGGRTLGYRVREEILPLDAPVYVLGVVTPDGEIARPPQDSPLTGETGFIISHRSEEAMTTSHANDGWILWSGAGALAGGAVLLVIAAAVAILFL